MERNMPAVTVHFGTNRNRTNNGDLFGIDFASNAAPGHYVTGRITLHQINLGADEGWAWDEGSLELDDPIDPKSGSAAVTALRNITATSAEETAGAALFARQQIAQTRTLGASAGFSLFHLHGFASTFRDSMQRAAQIAHNYGAQSVFTFSWPANGRVNEADYRDDRIAAEKSGPAITDALTRFLTTVRADRPRRAAIFELVVHSMGAYALRNAMQAIQKAQPELLEQSVFRNAFLMAADDDDDSLGLPAKLARLYDIARTVQVYRSSGDLALAASQIINGVPRLGLVGPRDWSKLPAKRTVCIDCSDVGATKNEFNKTHFGHQYYRIRPEVLRDVRAVLAGMAPGRIPGRFPAMAPRPGEVEYYIGFGS
jgi:esterase/lipase superfamily enzyme